MTDKPPHGARWRTSSHRASASNCVEVAIAAAAVGVRDTKNRACGTLVFGRRRWQRFLGAVNSGELDT